MGSLLTNLSIFSKYRLIYPVFLLFILFAAVIVGVRYGCVFYRVK